MSGESARGEAEGGALVASGFANDIERIAFERFRDQLVPLGWTIAHNLYVSLADERGRKARELDLLLLHPDHGIVLVEVKGGRVERHADGVWFQNGDPMDRSPEQQVTSAVAKLRTALKAHPVLKSLGITPRVGWMLCLPQADLSAKAVASIERSVTMAPDQVIDRTAMAGDAGVAEAVAAFTARVGGVGRAAGARPDGAPGADPGTVDWVASVVEVLLPEFEFSTSLVGDLEVDLARLIADERIHRDWVENLGGISRLHFEAGAGGGKSVVARLRALSLAEQGKRVLVVCSTASLAKSLQRTVADRAGGRAVVNTLHQVLVLAARGTKRSEDFGVPADGPIAPAQLVALPSFAGAIAAASEERYDALVIDEAQDIGAAAVEALSGFLHDPANGSIWTFADAFQRFTYDATADDAPESVALPAARGSDTVVMRQNHRNPEPVFRLAEGLRADGVARVSRKGEISSHRIDYRPCEDDSPATQRAVLEQVLDELAAQRIQAGRIAVVTMGKTDHNAIFTDRRLHGRSSRYRELGNPQLDAEGRRLPVPVDQLPAPDPNKVYFDSARRMKGIERGVVILVDVPDPGPAGSLERRLLYAGVTRATTYLCVIATAERIGALKAIASSYRA